MAFPKTEDKSGLHDLQALATSAKKRRSQRMSSEMDAQDSLLQSSAALDAVVLPDPKKQTAIPVIGLELPKTTTATAASAASATASPAIATSVAASVAEPQDAKSSRTWLVAGIGVLAIAGAAAFFVMQDKSAKSEAAAPEIAAQQAGLPESEIPTPVMPALAEDERGEQEDEAAELAAADSEEASEPTEAEAEASDPEPAAEPAEEDKQSETRAVRTADADSNPDRAAARAEKAAAKAAAKAEKAAAKAEKAAAKAEKAETPEVASASGSKSNLDDVLSSVTGGVDKPIVEEKDEGPSKKRLERGDVAKAMKKISPKAKSCYSKEEFSGVVTVKYSVGSDGSVTKAAATGAHKSSPTGLCVVSAVKSATFPAFSGATMSFSFPFLLSP